MKGHTLENFSVGAIPMSGGSPEVVTIPYTSLNQFQPLIIIPQFVAVVLKPRMPKLSIYKESKILYFFNTYRHS